MVISHQPSLPKNAIINQGLEDKTVAVLGAINLLLVLGDEKYKQELCKVFDGRYSIYMQHNTGSSGPELSRYHY